MILAIDQGTTGTTCLVVDAAGRVRGRACRELAQHFPAPGLVEHDPVEILATVRATGRPVHRAIVWQDRRTAERCRALAPRAAWLAERTGLVPDPYFSATKLEWLLAQPAQAPTCSTPGAARRARRAVARCPTASATG